MPRSTPDENRLDRVVRKGRDVALGGAWGGGGDLGGGGGGGGGHISGGGGGGVFLWGVLSFFFFCFFSFGGGPGGFSSSFAFGVGGFPGDRATDQCNFGIGKTLARCRNPRITATPLAMVRGRSASDAGMRIWRAATRSRRSADSVTCSLVSLARFMICDHFKYRS